MDKIIHVIVEDTPKSDNPWVSEKFQRNAIDRGLSQLDLKHGDIIIIGDVDEISDSETIETISREELTRPVSLEMDFYFYNFNCRNVKKWYKTKVVPYIIYKQYPDLDNLRLSSCDTIKNGGWYLSYFGTPEFISNKLSNFSHQEYNNDNYNNIELIKNRIDNYEDLFGNDSKFEKVESNYLPKNYHVIS